VDDETGGEDVLVYSEVRRRVLDAVQMRILGASIGDDVQPELVVGVIRSGLKAWWPSSSTTSRRK